MAASRSWFVFSSLLSCGLAGCGSGPAVNAPEATSTKAASAKPEVSAAPAASALAVDYSPRAGGLSARFPVAPTIDPLDFTGQALAITGEMASVATPEGVWLATTAAVKRADGVDCAVIARDVQANAVDESGCRAAGDKETATAGGLIRDAEFACEKSQMRGRVRTFCFAPRAADDGFKVYLALVAFKQSQDRGADLAAFLDGFHVTAPEPR